MRRLKRWADRLLTLAFGVCVLVVVWVLLQVTCFTSFRVPSPSMYPALIPGDTVEIRKGCYWINGTRKDRRWARMDTGQESCQDERQWNVALGWTVRQLGPLPVPARGQEVAMDTLTGKMYGRLIAWEQKKPLTVRDDSVFLGDSLIGNYRFQENYYFMAGDNLDNSKDSRYWGLVPEPYIVGVATRVWKSVSPQGGEVRWNRTMKKIE